MRLIDAVALERKYMSADYLDNDTAYDVVAEIDSMPTVKQWISCREMLPEVSAKTVLATVETKTFKHRYICEAVWIPRWTWKADFDSWEDCSEYNEDEDEFYVLEGWYERVHNWDDYSYVGIEEDVIAWQPLPEPYREESK